MGQSEGGAVVRDAVGVLLYVISYKLIWVGFIANVRY
jgi:hypothetical protein